MTSGNSLRPAKHRSLSTTAKKKTYRDSWIDFLYQALAQVNKPQARLAVLGVGHELRGDDAAGIAVVRALQSLSNERSLFVDAGAAPENFTGVLRDFAPDLVLIIDAAQMNEPPGTTRLLAISDTENCSVTTHTLSCHMLALYLETELHCAVKLLGIQPGQDLLGAELSLAVRQSVRAIVRVLRSLRLN